MVLYLSQSSSAKMFSDSQAATIINGHASFSMDWFKGKYLLVSTSMDFPMKQGGVSGSNVPNKTDPLTFIWGFPKMGIPLNHPFYWDVPI